MPARYKTRRLAIPAGSDRITFNLSGENFGIVSAPCGFTVRLYGSASTVDEFDLFPGQSVPYASGAGFSRVEFVRPEGVPLDAEFSALCSWGVGVIQDNRAVTDSALAGVQTVAPAPLQTRFLPRLVYTLENDNGTMRHKWTPAPSHHHLIYGRADAFRDLNAAPAEGLVCLALANPLAVRRRVHVLGYIYEGAADFFGPETTWGPFDWLNIGSGVALVSTDPQALSRSTLCAYRLQSCGNSNGYNEVGAGRVSSLNGNGFASCVEIEGGAALYLRADFYGRFVFAVEEVTPAVATVSPRCSWINATPAAATNQPTVYTGGGTTPPPTSPAPSTYPETYPSTYPESYPSESYPETTPGG